MAELPEKFTESDVVLYLSDKAKAAEGSRVTVDGTLKVIPGDPKSPGSAASKSCYLQVEWAAPG
jgi:hypothetical protein